MVFNWSISSISASANDSCPDERCDTRPNYGCRLYAPDKKCKYEPPYGCTGYSSCDKDEGTEN